jgi:hypothetical protein
MSDASSGGPQVVDPSQLIRIEAVHRGFLFQHLYAVRCLLLAPGTDVVSVVVESDEDVEVVRLGRRTYVQVKSRVDTLANADVDSALERFERYRELHKNGLRSGACEFVIATNAPLAPSLASRVESADWPVDVRVDAPGRTASSDPVVPQPPPSIAAAVQECSDLATRLPFGTLAPETLVWKLAGAVMAASSGAAPRRDHTFNSSELTALFELLMVQLQDFPAPPALYRPQEDEPALHTEAQIRLVTGFSGAGKTSWAAQCALHSHRQLVYFDLRDVPGPGIATGLARELAARLFGSGGGLGSVLLPGASGLELLRHIGTRALQRSSGVTIVLDNAHSPPPADVAAAIRATGMRVVLLAHPGASAHELAALLGVTAESLKGWSRDTVAQAANATGCITDPRACDALLALTGGLPLFVQNALKLAASENGGDVGKFSAALASLTHSMETAQELILERVVRSLPDQARHALGVLSLFEVPMMREELSAALSTLLQASDASVAANLRKLRTAGLLEVSGADRLKVHDAVRIVGRGQFEALGKDLRSALHHARDVLQRSVQVSWDYPKVKAFIRLLAETGEIKTLVQLAGDELFHELGLWPEIESRLRDVAASDSADPEMRFWALDGLVFNAIRIGAGGARARIDEMKALLERHPLGSSERLALGMKEMNVLAREGRRAETLEAIARTAADLKDTPVHQRIFRYNAAAALFLLGDAETAAREAQAIAQQYFDVLGLDPNEMVGRNEAQLRALIQSSEESDDAIKHLADSLDLLARAQSKLHNSPLTRLTRIQAMKFYNLAHAPESLVKVGQDLADDFVQAHDFAGARLVMEQHVLPVVGQLKMASHMVEVTSFYAVVLAYCGAFDRAEAEFERLSPYEAALGTREREGVQRQRQLVADLRRNGPPPQASTSFAPVSDPPVVRVGRNERCPCGSGRKFKRCHGP